MDLTGYDTLAIGAGPGGMDEAARLIGAELSIIGVDTNRDACATATAAGHHRIQADLRDIEPAHLAGITGMIITCPCPTFSRAGKGSGLKDYQLLLDAITCIGSPCPHDCWRLAQTHAADPRTTLMAHCFHLLTQAPDLDWFVMEQVPALEYCWEDIAAELYAAGWASVEVDTLDAMDYGAGARRKRTFSWGRKYGPTGSARARATGCTPAAAVLGWGPGETIRTRNNRKPGGGNDFSTDKPAWCLTGKARSWYRTSDGTKLTSAEAGALQGFRRDYPWSGARTSQFQQIGDVVNPLVGAAVLGAVLDLDWQRPVQARARALHNGNGHATPGTA